jgi:hypothetical protein
VEEKEKKEKSGRAGESVRLYFTNKKTVIILFFSQINTGYLRTKIQAHNFSVERKVLFNIFPNKK